MDENREDGGGGREPGHIRSDGRGGSEDAREGVIPTSNQQPHPQDPMSQRDRRIIWRTRAQRREAKGRSGEDGGEAKKSKKPQKSYGTMWKSGETRAEGETM